MNYTIGSSGWWEIDILRLKIQNKNKRIKISIKKISNFFGNFSFEHPKFLSLLEYIQKNKRMKIGNIKKKLFKIFDKFFDDFSWTP